MIKPAVLDAMVAAGCTAEQIAAAVKADQAGSSGALRQARYRARMASSDERDVTSVTVTDAVSPKETSPAPPKEITPSTVSKATAFSTETRASFDEFWSIFPNKVGKRDAEREFGLALKRASFADIMAGLRRYVAKTDDRPWCNPSTFLHQDRWADQPAEAVSQRATAPPDRPPRNAGEFASLELQRLGLNHDATSPPTRYFDEGDASTDVAGSGFARRIAIASSR